MKIWVDRMGSQPIYSQICLQIKKQICTGKLKEGELLPSIRSLAKELRISVITTKRAYEELEREGYLYTVVGKGSFAAKKELPPLQKEKLKKLRGLLQQAGVLAKECGVSDEELLGLYQSLKKE
ncbi:MAG: GntR family transcriptional regulator [Oscillospiraceae bacterium]